MEKNILVIIEFVINDTQNHIQHDWTIENTLRYMTEHNLDHLIKSITISKFIIKYTLHHHYHLLKKKGYSFSYKYLPNNVMEYWANKNNLSLFNA